MAIAEIEVAEGLLICRENLALVYAAVGVVFRRAGRKGDSESGCDEYIVEEWDVGKELECYVGAYIISAIDGI